MQHRQTKWTSSSDILCAWFVLCFGKRCSAIKLCLRPSFFHPCTVRNPTICIPTSTLPQSCIPECKHWYQSATQLVVPITTEENTGQHGSAVPGWQASLVCTQSIQQWASSSSHSARSVFTGLFWSRGRTPPGSQLIGWESCVPVESGQS